MESHDSHALESLTGTSLKTTVILLRSPFLILEHANPKSSHLTSVNLTYSTSTLIKPSEKHQVNPQLISQLL